MAEISLRLPFNGDYKITFGFGAIPESEDLKKKYSDWGLVGHNGSDYGLSVGIEVLASADGKVIQSGDNGDYGISVTLQHDFGQTIYGHLSETKVNVGDEPKSGDLIGLSGDSGNVTGPHLHFGLKQNNADENNGYLGYSDPSQYFSTETKSEEKPPEEKIPESEIKIEEQPQPAEPTKETEPTEQPKVDEPKPEEKKEEVKQPEIKEVITEVPVEVIKEVIKEVPVVDQAELDKQVSEKLKEKLKSEQDERRKSANEARSQKKKDNLNKILELTKNKKQITNDDVRELLHVSQSTATNYLTELVNRGMLKIDKKSQLTTYSA